jgi:hypothetical protein
MRPITLTNADFQRYVEAVANHGSIKAAAEALGVSRSCVQENLDKAAAAGLTTPRTRTSNPSRWRPGAEIVAARKGEYERVVASKRRHGNVVHRPDDGPFMLVVLGDPHLDSPGTSLDLWEAWTTGVLDRRKHITGLSIGDVLENWTKSLAHLYAAQETPEPEGWILLEHYLDQIGEDLDASVAGNHDAWSGHSDVLGMLMGKHGVLHESHALQYVYRCPSGREVSINARHAWQGRSMWNTVHGIKRAARMGERQNILLGGHTHGSGEGVEKCPMTGRISHCYQVASFKIMDDFAEQHGFMDHHLSPAVGLVIDPRRPDTDAEMVKSFYDPQAGADYLRFLRRKK